MIHSIMHGGLSLRNICPAVFQYIITSGDMESMAENLNLEDNVASAEVAKATIHYTGVPQSRKNKSNSVIVLNYNHYNKLRTSNHLYN